MQKGKPFVHRFHGNEVPDQKRVGKKSGTPRASRLKLTGRESGWSGLPLLPRRALPLF